MVSTEDNMEDEENGGLATAVSENDQKDVQTNDDGASNKGTGHGDISKYSPEDQKMIEYLLGHGMDQAAQDLQKMLDEKMRHDASSSAASEGDEGNDEDGTPGTNDNDHAVMTTTEESPAKSERPSEKPLSPESATSEVGPSAVAAATSPSNAAEAATTTTTPKSKKNGGGTFFKKILAGGIKVPKLNLTRVKSKEEASDTTSSNIPPTPTTQDVDSNRPPEERNDDELNKSSSEDEDDNDSDSSTQQENAAVTGEVMDELDDLSEVDMSDLDNMLNNLDIDRDFQSWSLFRKNMVRRAEEMDGSPPERPTPDEEMLETEDIEHWQKRLTREEVFSHRYNPTKDEAKELSEVAKIIHPAHNSIMNAFFSTAASNDSNEALFKRLMYPDPRKCPACILLKRGPVLFETTYDQEVTEQEAELVLLTHGCVISTVVPPEEQNDSEREKGDVIRKFERAIEWKNLVCVAPNEDDDFAFEIVVRGAKGQERLTLVTGSDRQQEAWMNAMESVLVQWHMRKDTAVKHLGWQYRLVHKPGFTLAVTNVEDDLGFSSATLRTLDEYNGYAPIHYAVRLGNEHALGVFLAAGVDPNLTDADGLTPVYHAVRDEVSRSILELLEAAGATKDIEKAQQDRDELFDRVVATEHEREERREQVQQKEAMAAQAKMSENMRLLNERGQKIEEASDKARQMNENAYEYADLARQLKEKTKKQASWNPFK